MPAAPGASTGSTPNKVPPNRGRASRIRAATAMRVFPIPCLADNYAYLLVCRETKEAALVDPSEPGPVLHALKLGTGTYDSRRDVSAPPPSREDIRVVAI